MHIAVVRDIIETTRFSCEDKFYKPDIASSLGTVN